jgi:hypothetical protein
MVVDDPRRRLSTVGFVFPASKDGNGGAVILQSADMIAGRRDEKTALAINGDVLSL